MKRCLGAGLALAILASAGMVVRVAAAEPVAVSRSGSIDVSPAQSGFAPGLPLKREADGDALGPRSATLAATGILLVAVWVAVQYRRRQRGVARKGRAPALPWLGQLFPDTQARQLRVVESTSLTPHARLHVVVWKGREYLVSTAPDHVRVLDRREIPAEHARHPASEAG